MTGKRHPFLGRYRVGFDDDGRLLALDAQLVSDGGWSLDLSDPVTSRAMFHVDNAYAVPHLRVTGQVARTNTVSHTAFRGFGGPQGMLVAEEVLDRVARHLGLLPEVVRERNLYRGPEDGGSVERSTTHYGQRVLDNRLPRIWAELAERSRLRGAPGRGRRVQRQRPARPPRAGRSPRSSSGSRSPSRSTTRPARWCSCTSTAASSSTTAAPRWARACTPRCCHVAARTLGVRPERFRTMPTATDKVPNTSATAASSGADLNGQAVHGRLHDDPGAAGRRRRPDARPRRPRGPRVRARSGCSPPGSPPTGSAGPRSSMAAYDQLVSLSATGYYRTPNLVWDPAAGRGTPFHYFAFGAAVSEVEVDGFTGTYRLRAVDVVHDVGDSLNPLVDRGQVEGGFVQGMGWLTMEECVWDGDGRLRTVAPSTYKIPTMAEVPEHFDVHLLGDARTRTGWSSAARRWGSRRSCSACRCARRCATRWPRSVPPARGSGSSSRCRPRPRRC